MCAIRDGAKSSIQREYLYTENIIFFLDIYIISKNKLLTSFAKKITIHFFGYTWFDFSSMWPNYISLFWTTLGNE